MRGGACCRRETDCGPGSRRGQELERDCERSCFLFFCFFVFFFLCSFVRYGSNIPIGVLAERVAGYVHQYTLFASLRPFGAAVLVGGWDETRQYQLFSVDPAGNAFGYRGTGIGKAGSSARCELSFVVILFLFLFRFFFLFCSSFIMFFLCHLVFLIILYSSLPFFFSPRNEIEKLPLSEMSAREAVRAVARIVHSVHDEVKDRDWELELSWIADETGHVHRFVPEALFAEAQEAARAAQDLDD